MVNFIRKVSKPKKPNSSQLEIWDIIKKSKVKRPTQPNKTIANKNSNAKKTVNEALRKIYANIYELEKSIPKNIDPKNEYLNAKALATRSKMKSLEYNKKILGEYKDRIEHVPFLSENVSSTFSSFFEKKTLNAVQTKRLHNIHAINTFLKNNPTQFYQKAELLVKLSNDIYQLRLSLSKTIKTRTMMKKFDAMLIETLAKKVPF